MIKLPLLKSALTITALTLTTVAWAAQPPKVPVRRPAPATIRFQPPPPPDLGEPNNRGQGGGSRGSCKQYENLTALLPIADAKTPWGFTVSERPTVWVYAPAGLAADVPMRFSLRDRQANDVYTTQFKSTALPAGVLRLTLPNSIKLQTQQSYQWSLTIDCGGVIEDRPKVVLGNIHRLALASPLKRALTAATTPLQQAKIYAEHGIWYDALTTLGLEIAQNQSAPADVKTAWRELLSAQQLAAAAAAPIGPCCTLK
jgi:Domain of Unknown Function (DUF928)